MRNNLPILGIETSGELCSVALMLNENTFFEMNILKKHVHSEKLIEIIDVVLKSADKELKNLSHIAVSIGPGSFTGLRIGLTAAKSLAFGANIPISTVPTFNALAMQISGFVKERSKFAIIRKASIDDSYVSICSADKNSFGLKLDVNLILSEQISTHIKNIDQLFGDSIVELNIANIIGPTAINICKWSYFFGKDLLTFDYDYLEPHYLKNFIVRVKK